MNYLIKIIILIFIFSLILVSSTSYVYAFSLTNIEDPLVILETTQGEIIIDFFPIDAPTHFENFILLFSLLKFSKVLSSLAEKTTTLGVII